MNTENMVTSLEVSKKLQSIGIKKESFFKWYIDEVSGYSFIVNPSSIINSQRAYPEKYSAFTSNELLSILNADIRISKYFNDPSITVYYQPENGTDNSYTFTGSNLADLLAQVIVAQHREGEFK